MYYYIVRPNNNNTNCYTHELLYYSFLKPHDGTPQLQSHITVSTLGVQLPGPKPRTFDPDLVKRGISSAADLTWICLDADLEKSEKMRDILGILKPNRK